MSRWNHPICDKDWKKLYAERVPYKMREPLLERCHFCDKPTTSGIYVRMDPKEVPYPEPLEV